MGVTIRKKDGESPNALIYRFGKKIQQSGVLREVKKRRFTKRRVTKNKRRQSALYKAKKAVELKKARRMGLA
ncbi:MAG: 30S ribosomal protein S21 [Candidatus Colwellbacteria bacterium]|nr:30S ribosomal protein S21 [Candidatus Colwellbacteria bacterium]